MTAAPTAVATRTKLIEVALPLEAINKASKREKSIRHGHPSTLHLWWARRPLAAARAVIFAQMVDDPSACLDEFPTEEEQERERERLFGIIERLVQWENTTNEAVLEEAREEIRRSWRRACADNAAHPRAGELFDPARLPAFHDPFAGGGSLPLEAQRLGLEAHASDLNPVAVLINKAMIEIPPRFAGRPPVNPEAAGDERLLSRGWRGAQGLADDVRYYGRWMRDEAERRIGHLYPKVRVTADMAADRPDLDPYVDRELTVIAWLWARTVKSPNPAFAHVDVPLASTFVLSRKKGREAYVEPVIKDGGYEFTVKVGTPPESASLGTTAGKRSAFRCLMSEVPVTYDHIRSEGQAGRMGARLMAIVAQGQQGRVYLPPVAVHEEAATSAKPEWRPETPLPDNPRDFKTPNYGMATFGDLFTDRQLVTLTTFSDLVGEARERIRHDAIAAGLADDGVPLREGGVGATAYAEAVGVYLAFVVDKCADYWSTVCTWHNTRDLIRNTFARQAIPMTWDYAEANPTSDAAGSALALADWVHRAAKASPAIATGAATQGDAQSGGVPTSVQSTDPPYYDNIGYADLSDFFYVWLRRLASSSFPKLFSTMAVPKSGELVATPYRHGTKEQAEKFFLDGMTVATQNLASQSHPAFPVTIYYAFKQAERKDDKGVVSTGWATFLKAVIEAGFSINGTWPVRTELANKLLAQNANTLASSIVLVCRRRPADAPTTTRREFQRVLRAKFPEALAHLQRGNIAPVDLAQASIGPGMSVFTRYREVLNADGSAMSVGDALALINATLDEVLEEQEDDLDKDSRWALPWFEQHGHGEGEYGLAEQLSKAKNTSVGGLVEAGIVEASRGKVRILRPDELDDEWHPGNDARRLTVWEMTHHLIRLLGSDGEAAAADLARKLGGRAELARDLAYRLYLMSERKRRPADALAYNGLVQSWPEITRLAREEQRRQAELVSDGV